MVDTSIVIALAGNPNSGKTSIFNFITGSRQHVGNYPGVTVEKKEGVVPVDNTLIKFVDLPGTYSLGPYTLEEYIACREILSNRLSGVIVIVDTSRLERSLYLVSQIIEMEKPVVIALNMYDELESSGSSLNIEQLSSILGIPCVKTVGNRGKGITELIPTALKAVKGEIPAIGKPPRYSHEMEHSIDKVVDLIKEKAVYNERWSAINLLLYGISFSRISKTNIFTDDLYEKVDSIRSELEKLEGRTINSIVAAGRYGFASGAAAECLSGKKHTTREISDKIDTILTHKWFGFPIFLVVLWIIFQLTFMLGEIPMKWLDSFFTWFGNTVSVVIPGGFFNSLIVDGIIAGVGGVLIFLPNIIILFFFISLLEDTGYMARTAFIMDKIMHFFGMHGKSFLPMLVGFGCTVPAIMATRILENRKDRIITMFILPFMSCGAKMPVYILLAGAFFTPHSAGNVIFSIYLFGIILALFVAKILSFSSGPSTPFVMELPPYRIPTKRSVFLHIWERAYLYLKKAGTIILTASIIIWFLMSFPKPPDNTDIPGKPVSDYNRTQLEYSYAGKFGKMIEPVLKPLGFDWRIGLALTAGFVAKEVIVSTLGTIYSIGEDNETAELKLKRALRNDPSLNSTKAYGLMLFILVYIPCIAVLSILRREAGGLKWVGLMIIYTTSLAWLICFTFKIIAEIFQ